jgi:hypothetical protein
LGSKADVSNRIHTHVEPKRATQETDAIAMDRRVPTCNICDVEAEVDEPLAVIEREGNRESSPAQEPGFEGGQA